MGPKPPPGCGAAWDKPVKQRGVRSGSRWLLLEIAAAVFLFAMCAGVCATLFAQARRISQQSTDLAMAMVQAQRAAEAWKAADGDPYAAAEWLGGCAREDEITLEFGPGWQPGPGESAYALVATLSREGELARAAIAVRSGAQEIYRLDVAHRAGGSP